MDKDTNEGKVDTNTNAQDSATALSVVLYRCTQDVVHQNLRVSGGSEVFTPLSTMFQLHMVHQNLVNLNA